MNLWCHFIPNCARLLDWSENDNNHKNKGKQEGAFDLRSPCSRKAVVVWACGLGAFLATLLSLPVTRTASLGAGAGWSAGSGSGSLGGASMFTLALIVVSLSSATGCWRAQRRQDKRNVRVCVCVQGRRSWHFKEITVCCCGPVPLLHKCPSAF